MAATNPKHLPDHVLLEIFSKLPTKSVGRCRCLSKLWSASLSTPDFINKHLLNRKKALHKNEHLLLLREERPQLNIKTSVPIITITSVLKPEEETVTELDKKLTGEWTYLIGSCNGLVLFGDMAPTKLTLLNPVMKKQVIIPNWMDPEGSSNRVLSRVSSRRYGFGFDSVSEDYKIVAVDQYARGDDGERDTFVAVYSVRTAVWRNVASSGYRRNLRVVKEQGVLVNNALHWSTWENGTWEDGIRYVMVAFDLATEKFYTVQEVPETLAKKRYYTDPGIRILVLGECLCISLHHEEFDNNILNLWIMAEYGVVESWWHFRLVGTTGETWEWIDQVLCFVEEYKVVLRSCKKWTFKKWSVWDLMEGSAKIVAIGGGERAQFLDGCTFVDSLVSFEGAQAQEVVAAPLEKRCKVE